MYDVIGSPFDIAEALHADSARIYADVLERARRIKDVDVARLTRFIDHYADDFKPIAKALGPIGTVLDLGDVGQALAEGRTGDAIGKTGQMLFELTPPGRAASLIDAPLGLAGTFSGARFDVAGHTLDFSRSSPLDMVFQGSGNLMANMPHVKAGEARGSEISDALGLPEDSWGRNILTAGGGLYSHTMHSANPVFHLGSLVGFGR